MTGMISLPYHTPEVVADLNNVPLTASRVSVVAWSTTAQTANAPLSSGDGIVAQWGYGNYATQIALQRGTKVLKIRVYTNGTWSSWSDI